MLTRIKLQAPYRWQRAKTSLKQNTQCSGNTKNVSKQTSNRVFATSIFAILVNFAFEFSYKPLTLFREWYQKYISVIISYSSKIIL